MFFIDFLEGNLSDTQIRDLNKFLSKNSNLKEELTSFENLTLKPEKIKFEQKENLIKKTQKKHFNITQFEYLAVADIEKDITEAEKRELKQEIKKAENKLYEYNLIQKSKLKADKEISYPFKNKIRRKTTAYLYKISSYVAAAIIFLALILTQEIFNTDKTTKTGLKISSIVKDNYKTIKPSNNILKTEKHTITKTKNSLNKKQEVTHSHKQTNKLINSNKLLAFSDIEPQSEIKSYKELTVSVPEIKQEVLILNTSNLEIKNTTNDFVHTHNENTEKDKIWKYAEMGVNVWRKVSSSELRMKNKYKEDGRIEKLNLYASNFKISKTFNK